MARSKSEALSLPRREGEALAIMPVIMIIRVHRHGATVNGTIQISSYASGPMQFKLETHFKLNLSLKMLS